MGIILDIWSLNYICASINVIFLLYLYVDYEQSIQIGLVGVLLHELKSIMAKSHSLN